MASLVKTAMVRIVADDGDTQEKLDRIAAKAEELGRLNPDIKVKIDAAAASAEMAVLRRHLKGTGDASKLAADGERLLADEADRAGNSQGFLRTAIDGLAGALDSGGIAFSNFGASLGDSQAAGFSLNDALVALVPIAAGAAVALFPFITGLTLATAGVAGFAALAVPEISKVWTAVSQGGAAIKKLSPDERQMVGPIRDLKSEFAGLQKAIQPTVMTAFAEGLKIIKDLMPAIKPLIVAAGQALDGFLKNIDKWLDSSSGQKFIHWLEFEGPRAMAVFGRALWDTTKIVGRVFDFLYNTGERFDGHWKVFWHKMAMIVDGFRTGFTQMGDLVRHDFDSITHTASSDLDTVRENLIGSGHDVETWANDVGQYTMDAVRWFGQLPGRIMSALAALPGDLVRIGADAIRGLLSGIESGIGAVLGTIEHLASDVSGAFSKVLSIFSPSLVFRRHGQMIAAGLALGIDDGRGGVMAATQRMAAATLGGSAGGYGTGAGGVVRVQLEWAPSTNAGEPLIQWLRQQVRVKGGGNVQTALGRP